MKERDEMKIKLVKTKRLHTPRKNVSQKTTPGKSGRKKALRK